MQLSLIKMSLLKTVETLQFGDKLQHLLHMLYSKEQTPYKTKTLIFKELIEMLKNEEPFNNLLQEVKQDLRAFYEELVALNKTYDLRYFEYTFPHVEWHQQRHKHFYTDAHNVHKIVRQTVNMALQIIEKYPAVYVRPFEHEFFSVIENADVFQSLSIPSLFASIELMISKHPQQSELRQRLLEEMNDSNGVCVAGHVTRLLNSIRGFCEFDINLDDYDASRAKIFHQINKRVDLDNFITSVEYIVNNHLDLKDLPLFTILRILRDYSKCEWIFENGKYISSG